MRLNAYLHASLFSLCLALAFVPLKSNALTEGDYTYTTNAAGQATITDFNSAYAGALSITNTLGGCSVTAIGAYAFEGCPELSSVTLPGSVTASGFTALWAIVRHLTTSNNL